MTSMESQVRIVWIPAVPQARLVCLLEGRRGRPDQRGLMFQSEIERTPCLPQCLLSMHPSPLLASMYLLFGHRRPFVLTTGAEGKKARRRYRAIPTRPTYLPSAIAWWCHGSLSRTTIARLARHLLVRPTGARGTRKRNTLVHCIPRYLGCLASLGARARRRTPGPGDTLAPNDDMQDAYGRTGWTVRYGKRGGSDIQERERPWQRPDSQTAR